MKTIQPFEECAACRLKPGFALKLCKRCLAAQAEHARLVEVAKRPTEPVERAVFVSAYAHVFRGDHEVAVRSAHAAVSYLRMTGDVPKIAAFAEPLLTTYYDRRPGRYFELP